MFFERRLEFLFGAHDYDISFDGNNSALCSFSAVEI